MYHLTCRPNCPADREGHNHCRSSPEPVCRLHPDLTPDSIVRQTHTLHREEKVQKIQLSCVSHFLRNPLEVVNRMSDTLMNWRYKKRILTIIEDDEG